jgi:outer membrane immunogenic protein
MEKNMSFRFRVITLALGAAIMLPSVAAAQTAYPATFGLKAGVNSSTLSSDDDLLDVGSLWGAVAGAFIGKNMSDNLSLQLEGLFSQRGAKDNTFGDDAKIRLTYLDVPLTARFGSTTANNVHFHAFTGPQLGIKLSSKYTDDADSDVDLDDSVKSWDFGWTVGAGVEMNRVSLDARYTLGLTNIDESDSGSSLKNRTFTVLLGYRFR